MASIINLTGLQSLSWNVTSSGLVVPPLSNSIDVSAYDILDMQFGVSQISPSSINLFIITSMQNDVDDVSGVSGFGTASTGYSWIAPTALAWTSVGGATLPQFTIKTATTGFMRYIRWAVNAPTGSGNVTFWIRGMGRRYGT